MVKSKTNLHQTFRRKSCSGESSRILPRLLRKMP